MTEFFECYGECGCADCYGQIRDCSRAFAAQYPTVWEQVESDCFRQHWPDVYQGIYDSEQAFVKWYYGELQCDILTKGIIDFDTMPFDRIDWAQAWRDFELVNSYFSVPAECGGVHIFHNI